MENTRTSKAVMFSPWIFMTAVWIKSNPEPVTTIILPPLKKKKRHTHIHIFDSKVKGISVFSVTQRQAHRESNRNTNMVLILHLV